MKKYYNLCVLLSFTFFILHSIPLFDHYPTLLDHIPYVSIANLPTPIQELKNLETHLDHPALFVKRDDLTANNNNVYGGNKVRKLEFLLGDAQKNNATRVITYGCVGSNHALATACYAHQLGLPALLMVKNQPNSPVIRQNLLLDHYFDADIIFYNNNAERKAACDTLLAINKDFYFFPTGGSVALGALGYVNAALELKEQINQGIMPEPDFIYLPIGSCGTTAGLLLGLQLAGLHSHVIAVAVEPSNQPNDFIQDTEKLFKETNELLHNACSDILLYDFPTSELTINKDFEGPNYGVIIPEAEQAMALISATENITTEPTYSAKALAALVKDINSGKISKDQTVLWWNTYCGLDFSHLTSTVNYKDLPLAVHHYFEELESN